MGRRTGGRDCARAGGRARPVGPNARTELGEAWFALTMNDAGIVGTASSRGCWRSSCLRRRSGSGHREAGNARADGRWQRGSRTNDSPDSHPRPARRSRRPARTPSGAMESSSDSRRDTGTLRHKSGGTPRSCAAPDRTQRRGVRCCPRTSPGTSREQPWTCAPSRGPGGWNDTAGGITSTGCTTTSGGTSSTGPTVRPLACRIRARSFRTRVVRQYEGGHRHSRSPSRGSVGGEPAAAVPRGTTWCHPVLPVSWRSA